MLKTEEIRHRRSINKTICGSVLVLLSFVPMTANACLVSDTPYDQGYHYENYRDIAILPFAGNGTVCLAAEQLNGMRLGGNAGHVKQEASVCQI